MRSRPIMTAWCSPSSSSTAPSSPRGSSGTPREFYDYEAKYVADDTRYLIPSGLPPQAEAAIQGEALRAFAALGCRGWGRVDLMLDHAGKPQFLEVNTSPGMTDHSLVPMAARHAGIPFEDLCARILALAALEGGDARVG